MIDISEFQVNQPKMLVTDELLH